MEDKSTEGLEGRIEQRFYSGQKVRKEREGTLWKHDFL